MNQFEYLKRCVAGLMSGLLLWCSSVLAAQGFRDDFTGSMLDPAWEVRAYTGPWPRAEGQMSPANHYEMVGGALRYYVDPMTYGYGFVNHYQTWHPYHDYDPGLELHRVFEGDHWVFDSRVLERV